MKKIQSIRKLRNSSQNTFILTNLNAKQTRHSHSQKTLARIMNLWGLKMESKT